ncbi:hypothetical protein GCM10023321_39320 [Pseudonocardia eucalypti]|uniref:HTH marR-type domain-containing protein n=1 Tax=Pseudonocardia eucalypti TaxID=648755 RepID=A0ABP9Q9N1_9PSEU|nr:DNA-binding MarR family transcriptional regulator [Pseudonocardia eucalypti]
MPTLTAATPENSHEPSTPDPDDYARQLEAATRALLEVNEAVLQEMDRTVGIASIRALQALERRGPLLVTELGNELDMLASTASRLSDRLADAQLITRRVAPKNRRATQLELSARGRTVLAELAEARTAALHTVTRHLSNDEQAALLTGARAFTQARNQQVDQPSGPNPDQRP